MASGDGNDLAAAYAAMRRLRVAALVEGTTLLALLFVAVPVKHLAGYPAATSIMGPVHGMAFIFYAWTVFGARSAGEVGRGTVGRLLIAAVLPFGFVATLRWLQQQQAALAATAIPTRGAR